MAKIVQMIRHACLMRHPMAGAALAGRGVLASSAAGDRNCMLTAAAPGSSTATTCLVTQASMRSNQHTTVRWYSRKGRSEEDKPSDQMYDAYEEFTALSPFKVPSVERSHGYFPKVHTGGLLPRPKGDYEDRPLKGTKPIYKQDRDAWTKEKALFGQNDYIDILGDGSLHPWQLYQAPMWLKGWRGTELEQLIRRKRYTGRQMRHMHPAKYHALNKRIFYLWKKTNLKRSSAPFWGNRRRANTGRIDVIRGK